MQADSFRIIRFRLIVIFVIAVSAVITFIIVLNNNVSYLINKNSEIGSVINISGRQRMLSQNISKTSLILASQQKQANVSSALDSMILLFDSSHHYLHKQNKLLEIDNSARIKIDSLFEIAEGYHHTIIQCGNAISNGDSLNYEKRIKQLLQAEGDFLPIMNNITGEYEAISKSILESIDAKVSHPVNIYAFSILLSAFFVLFITLRIFKKYSVELDEIQNKLQASIDEKTFEIEKFEFLTQAISVGIWERNVIDETESWSNQLYQIFGFKPGEIAGTYDTILKRVHPNDKQLLIDASEASLKTGIPTTIEIRIQSKSGIYKWIEATGNVKRDQNGRAMLMVGGIEDIDARKSLESQLKVFVEYAPAAIAMFNKNIEYLAASKKWIKDYGLEEKIIMGVNHYALFPETREEWSEILNKSLEGSVERRDEVPFINSNKHLRWMKWEARPWYINEDEVGGILMFSEDITEEQQRKEELKNAKEEAEKASKAKEHFLATMSHEIRTPLTAIIGLTHILLSEDPRSDQIENLQLLRFSGDNLLTLINDILDISKIESGKLTLEYADFDLFYLIDNIKRSLAYRAEENMVEIDILYDENLPYVFVGDVTRISQILFNLTGNAIKFSNEGTVKIQVDQLSQNNDTYELMISVEDTGIGISPENQKRIFQSFEQAETGTTRHFGGTGLGLYITKKLLEMMDSQIHLESEVDKGSKFYFTLKLEKGSLDQTEKSVNFKIQDYSAKKVNVLIAEDNKTNQTIIKKFLNKSGVEYSIAANGVEVVERIQSKKYDMIFMDLQMPEMDGYDATIKIRSTNDEYYQNIPIIALTADAFHNMKEKAISIGITDYLSKPFNPVDFYAKINQYTGQVEKVITERSQIEKLIDEYAEGDTSFKSEFAHHCVQNYQQCITSLETAIQDQDSQLLQSAIHKITTLNNLFEQEELQKMMSALADDKKNFHNQKALQDSIKTKCHEIIDELNKISER